MASARTWSLVLPKMFLPPGKWQMCLCRFTWWKSRTLHEGWGRSLQGAEAQHLHAGSQWPDTAKPSMQGLISLATSETLFVTTCLKMGLYQHFIQMCWSRKNKWFPSGEPQGKPVTEERFGPGLSMPLPLHLLSSWWPVLDSSPSAPTAALHGVGMKPS